VPAKSEVIRLPNLAEPSRAERFPQFIASKPLRNRFMQNAATPPITVSETDQFRLRTGHFGHGRNPHQRCDRDLDFVQQFGMLLAESLR
jgi:hypothetical protein